MDAHGSFPILVSMWLRILANSRFPLYVIESAISFVPSETPFKIFNVLGRKMIKNLHLDGRKTQIKSDFQPLLFRS